MAMQSSGPISLADIQSTFGGAAPTGLNEYYSGGGLVPTGTTGTSGAIPSSGRISLNQFYGSTPIQYVPYTNAIQSTVNGEPVLIFKANGSITLPSSMAVRRLVVGGGGKGGIAYNNRSAGGGGGGVIDTSSTLASGTYQIGVGNGSKYYLAGYDKYGNVILTSTPASSSSFSTINVAGFGRDGANGQNSFGWGATGGASGNGNAGGPNGGGGGGAGVAAVDAYGTGVSLGGDGIQSDITGVATYYGGGGGGGAATSAGGKGGGGNAGAYQAVPQNGTDYLGGGGGGSSGYYYNGSGAWGGKGVVILRMPSNVYPVFGGMYIDIPTGAGGIGEGFYRVVASWINNTGSVQTVNISGQVLSNNTKTLQTRYKVGTNQTVGSGTYISMGSDGNGSSTADVKKALTVANNVTIQVGNTLTVEAYLWGGSNADKVVGSSMIDHFTLLSSPIYSFVQLTKV
jgi:hypothetical protein